MNVINASHHQAAARENGGRCFSTGFGFTEETANIVWAVNKVMGADCWFSTLKDRLGLPERILRTLPDEWDVIGRAFTFEKEHEALFAGRADHSLSVSELKANMLEAQKAAYGDGLDPEYLHPYMWQCKSHYYSADLHFYNFPYSFGLLFGRGVYALYEKEGEAFVPQYDELLRSTGSHLVADAAAMMGIDVRDQAFWETSLESLAKDIDKFVAMAEKR